MALFYELGVLFILVFFSLAIYGFLDRSLGDRLGFDTIGIELKYKESVKIIKKEKNNLRRAIIVIDGAILVVAAGASYALAGYTLRPIEDSYEKQKKFLADAAHELRTPLAVMKTGIQSVDKKTATQEEYADLASDVLEEVDFLNATVNDLLFLAKSDQMEKVPLEKTDLKSIIERQVDLAKPYADRKDVSLEISKMEEAFVLGNTHQLKRLLANLLKNAIDYNVPRGKVFVSCENKNNQVQLLVSDTGIGIPKEKISKIFDRFYKADSSRGRYSAGAGLGLSIVLEIIETHGGGIEVESRPDQGTRITVIFPSYA